MEESDALVVARIRSGDRDGFRILVDRHSRSVFRLAYRMTGNEFDAEDVVQETFLRAYKQLDAYESRSSFHTWIYRICANYSLDLIRSRQRHEDKRARQDAEGVDPLHNFPSAAPGQDRIFFNAEVKQKLDFALNELSRQERTAFMLRHFDGMSIEDIGVVLGLGTSATKNSIFRAVRKLREVLEPLLA
ncbi:MAG TPA: sigma-70 family RNA polymerase sigma factor [Bryobacteraceae bacterium]|nr:sigma-70 family RNA polymerase sigma factor [Bryobacteraceae bacterium]